MRPTILAVAFCLECALGFAGNWSGILVDSKCYASEERNVSPTDTLTHVDRDTNQEIRYCSPNAKTKSFAVVLPDGRAFDLDTTGNAKAAELVRNTGKMSRYTVAVTGEIAKNIIKADSIAMAP
jgi:hypothetical protein